MKRVKNKDLEDMVQKMEVTDFEIEDILDVKYINGTSIGYAVPPGINEVTDNISMMSSLFQ